MIFPIHSRRLLSLVAAMIAIFAVLSACRSGKTALKQGDYEKAVNTAIDRLRQNPKSKNARLSLQDAYPALTGLYQREINTLKTSSDTYRWEGVLNRYATLNQMHDAIRRCPGALRVIREPISYTKEQEAAALQAAEIRYALGEQSLARNTRESAKEAYGHYSRAEELKPGLRDLYAKKQQALSAATMFVLVEPIPSTLRMYDLNTEFFQNQLYEFVRNNTGNIFLRYVTPATIASTRPAHIVKMQFDNFVVGQAYMKETIQDRSKDSVVIREGVVETSAGKTIQKTYVAVTAKLSTWEKTLSSSGVLDVQIVDAQTGAVVSQRKFPGTFVWQDRWGSYQGDDRALTPADKETVKKNRELPNPPPQQLFTEFTKPIFTQVTGFVSDFYRSY